MFGVDIDSRDTTELIRAASGVTDAELAALEPRVEKLFGSLPDTPFAERLSPNAALADALRERGDEEQVGDDLDIGLNRRVLPPEIEAQVDERKDIGQEHEIVERDDGEEIARRGLDDDDRDEDRGNGNRPDQDEPEDMPPLSFHQSLERLH